MIFTFIKSLAGKEKEAREDALPRKRKRNAREGDLHQ